MPFQSRLNEVEVKSQVFTMHRALKISCSDPVPFLMLAFSVFLWHLSTMAHPPACGCMGLTGMFTSTKKAALFGLARNCLILWGLKLSYAHYVKPAPFQMP